jgi:nitroreductase
MTSRRALPGAESPAPVWNAVRSRRVIRRFARQPLAPEHLQRILDAGRRASSAKNLQRWEFIVCSDRDHLAELAAVGPWAGHLSGAAVGIALITPDPRASGAPLSILFDLGQAAANMMLVAWELGVGSVPATVYEPDLARALLGYPETHHCEYLLSFGYLADNADLFAPPRVGGRRQLNEVVHQERWGGG